MATGDYFDKDLTGRTAQQIASYIRLQLEDHPSVQLFRKDKEGKKRTICRTWRIEFDVADVVPDTD